MVLQKLNRKEIIHRKYLHSFQKSKPVFQRKRALFIRRYRDVRKIYTLCELSIKILRGFFKFLSYLSNAFKSNGSKRFVSRDSKYQFSNFTSLISNTSIPRFDIISSCPIDETPTILPIKTDPSVILRKIASSPKRYIFDKYSS